MAICRQIRFGRCPGRRSALRSVPEIVTRGMPADDAGLRHEALKQAQEDLDGMLAV
jgi:hypothetical protein